MAFDLDNFRAYAIGFNGYPQIWIYNCEADSFATVATANYFADLVNSVATGDKLIVKTTTAGLSFSGTFLNNGTTVSINWDNTLRFESRITDISAAETVYTSVLPAGVVIQTYGTQFGAVTSANAAITFSFGSTAITGGGITVLTTGVAGSSYSSTPTAANTADGSTPVKIVTDGASSTTAAGVFGVKIVCPAQI